MTGPGLTTLKWGGMYTLEIELTGKLPKMNTSHTRGRHWSVGHREAKYWMDRVWVEVQGLKPERPLKRARGTFTRHSSREPDYENLTYSFKEIVDALVKLDILEDDAPKNLERVYQWKKGKAGAGRVTIQLEEL